MGWKMVIRVGLEVGEDGLKYDVLTRVRSGKTQDRNRVQHENQNQ